jgi:hypothetical protein
MFSTDYFSFCLLKFPGVTIEKVELVLILALEKSRLVAGSVLVCK